MSSILELQIPETEDEVEVINRYYEYVMEKHRRYCPDGDGNQIESRKQRVLERRDEGGTLGVFEQVYSRLGEVIDWEAVYSVFDNQKKIAEPNSASCLASLFRDAKQRLIHGEGPDWDDGLDYTPEEIECKLETEVIALCEFAERNNYSVRLSE